MANLHDVYPHVSSTTTLHLWCEFSGSGGPYQISSRHNSWQGVPEADEFQAFFDCYETHEEMLQRVNSGEGPSGTGPRRYPLERIRSGEGQRSLGLVPEVWLKLSGVEDFRGCFGRSKG